MLRACYRQGFSKYLLALALVMVLVIPVSAQGNVTLNIDQMESGSAGAMQAYITVRDENGVPVSGLARENFSIVEDQRTSFPPDTLDTRVNPSAELAVALVIDLSGTMRDEALAEAKSASQKLLETLLSEPNDPDRAAFFGINGPVDINNLSVREENQEIGFTNDRNKILNLINTLQGNANVATPLYDALFRVIKITARQQGPRAIIVLTDGQDVRVSKLTADDPINEANRNNIPIFPIGFSKGTINDAYLTRLAARTGGTYTKATQAAEFVGLFQDIVDQLSEQYVLTYRTRLQPDAQTHAVVIRLESPKGKAFDDEIFTFSGLSTAAPAPVATQAPAATEIAAGAAAVATPEAAQVESSPPPTPAPTPEPFPQNVITALNDFVSNPKNLPILIAIIVLLVALLALIIFLIIRRNRAAQAGLDEGYYEPEPGAMAFEPPTAEGVRMAPTDLGSYPPTAGPYPAAGGVTQGPPGVQPYPSEPFPPAAGSQTPFSGAPVEGGTVILQRGPKVQVVAILVNRKQPQQRYDVLPSTDIGRANTNTIALQNTTISRQHAKIKLDKDEFMLFDLGSANGTFVNDEKVADPVALKDGDVVRFGELEFLFKRLA